jgi:exopolyphosphatase / guanosine-5'-triphosphate,3'-diphosphate pyrophosphatase
VTVAVVDVGSNTVRLLVARREGASLVPVREAREHLFLGEDVEREGRLSAERIAETAQWVRRYARAGRAAGADAVEVVVTAPGRQSANAAELVRALASASGAPVRVLSADEEGRLAFAGAVAAAVHALPETVAVCDVGGGSTEVVVGTPDGGPVWSRSLDIGAVRLTERFMGENPPRKRDLVAARAEVERHLEGFTPLLPQGALATGGTARALRKIVGRTLGEDDFEAVLRVLGKRSSAKVAKTFAFHERRARTLAAGAVILAGVQRRLGVSLDVSRAGLREGAALAILDELAVSAA